MPFDVLEVFVLYWATTIGLMAWIIIANLDLEKKLRKEEK